MEVPENEVHKYGVIAGQSISYDLIPVETMVEKPAKEDAPSNPAIIGRYILTPDIFDLIRDTEPGRRWRDPDFRCPDDAGSAQMRAGLQIQRQAV